MMQDMVSMQGSLKQISSNPTINVIPSYADIDEDDENNDPTTAADIINQMKKDTQKQTFMGSLGSVFAN